MRILLTGTSGQVGEALLKRDTFDLSRPETLGGLALDLIVNPAAYTAVDRAKDKVILRSA